MDMTCDAPQDNFAFEGMLINGERQTGTLNGSNGKDLSGEAIMNQNTYTKVPLEWDFMPQTGDWKMPSKGCLPILAWQEDTPDSVTDCSSYLSYLSVKDIASNKDGFSVYPSPTSDYVNVHISDNTPTNDLYAQVYDIMGRLLHTQILANKITRIDLTNFVSGVYIVKINHHTFKVVKK